MHELSLATGIVSMVDAALARETQPVRVRRLRVEVGAFAGVELRALRFALDALAAASALRDAEVEVFEVPGSAWCFECGQTVALQARLDPCPHCGGQRLQANGGTELRVVELTVEDLAAAEPALSH
jgi:hydrogenase nickel incorporation protein HypA/HybF